LLLGKHQAGTNFGRISQVWNLDLDLDLERLTSGGGRLSGVDVADDDDIDMSLLLTESIEVSSRSLRLEFGVGPLCHHATMPPCLHGGPERQEKEKNLPHGFGCLFLKLVEV
jgi:hypothetical protein